MSETKATRAAYGEALVKLGHENDKIVVLDADLSNATMTMNFAREFPNRHFDVGIAEANMVDMAAGMSTMGLIPFCSTFAVFAGRSYDQIRNGVCYPHFNVKLAFTHAGLSVGEDGGSHQAIEDIALMRVLPGMTVICPCDANETYQAVKAAAEIKGPVYLRLARLATPVLDPSSPAASWSASASRRRSCSRKRACIPPSSICIPSSLSTLSWCAPMRPSASAFTRWRSTPSSAAWAMLWPMLS